MVMVVLNLHFILYFVVHRLNELAKENRDPFQGRHTMCMICYHLIITTSLSLTHKQSHYYGVVWGGWRMTTEEDSYLAVCKITPFIIHGN